MSSNVIDLASRRPITNDNPWQADSECDCSACHVQRMGADLHDRLTNTSDLFSLEAADAMRSYLNQLADICGMTCQYEPRQVQ